MDRDVTVERRRLATPVNPARSTPSPPDLPRRRAPQRVRKRGQTAQATQRGDGQQPELGAAIVGVLE
jgi:hypothetical protein